MRSSFQFLKLAIGAIGFILLTAASGLAQGRDASSVGPAPTITSETSSRAITHEGLRPQVSHSALATLVSIGHSRPVRFSTDDPATLFPFGDSLASNFFAGGILLDGVAYAVEYGGNKLFTIDTATGALTEIGPMAPTGSEAWTGMAWDPTTFTAFATTDQSLYTVNLSTGAVSPVGSYGFAGDLMITIAVTDAGQMYGIGIASDTLFRINKTTGVPTPVGYIGFNANFAQDMAFERSSGTLYYAAYNPSIGGPEMRTVDIATGATALIGAFPSGTQIDALMFQEYSAAIAEEPQYFNYSDGTNTNMFPFNTPGGKAVNWLFLAGDFAKPSPLPEDQAITKIYFRTATAGNCTYTDLMVLMAQDTITALTTGTFYPGPYDTVYAHASTTLKSTVDGWMSIVLDRPFKYDPAKSLIMFVGQCGSTGSGINIRNTLLGGVRRTWSVGGCPFVPYAAGGDDRVLNFGVDVAPVTVLPQYFNANDGTWVNNFPFNVATGKAVNWLLLPGELNHPAPLPPGQAITTVYFRTSSHGTRTFTDLRILMAQDVITTLTSGAFYPGPYDTVYAQASPTLSGTVDGWMAIPLDHPFIYDPTKSLIISVEQCGSSGSEMQLHLSSATDIRRTWSVSGCPFAPYASGDALIANFGVDAVPVPTSFNVPEFLYYKFEENALGFTTNSAIPGVGTTPSPFTGSIGTGGQFDSAHVGTGLSGQGVTTGWNLDIGNRSWTIGMWLQIPSSTSGNAYYLFGDLGASSFRSFHNGAAGQNNLLLRGGGMSDLLMTGIGPDPTYVHFVYDSATATVKAYKNGVFAKAVTQGAPLNVVTGNGFKVGGYGTSAGYIGSMDEFRFYSRALNEAEVWLTWNHRLPFVPTSVDAVIPKAPETYELVQNYPNPFNPTTVISFRLPVAGHVKLVIFDLLGREIKTLVDEQRAPGTFQLVWNAENATGNRVSSGVYFYRLTATAASNRDIYTNVKKMILLK